MKKVIIILLLLCVGYWGALNQAKLKSWWHTYVLRDATASTDSASKTADHVEAVPSPPAEITPPVVVAPTPAPAVAPSKLPALGEGIYYTRERISQMTDQGVAVIPEATEVRKVGEQNGQFIIEGNGKRVLASPVKLTNDPSEVLTLTQAFKAATAAAAEAAAEKLKPKPEAPPPNPAQAREATTIKRQVLQAKIDELDRRISEGRTQIGNLQYQSTVAKANGRPSTYNDRAIATISGNIAALEAERSRLVLERAAIVNSPR